MKRLEKLFKDKPKGILNIYFTAGYPNLNDTEKTILALDRAGVDMVEIGMPYSDPLADGPTIQESGAVAIKNGMNLQLLFQQLKEIRTKTEIPLILMGYFNQVLQFGVEAFMEECRSCGIDGLILPDLPLTVYEEKYQSLFQEYGLDSIFLITPQTEAARIQKIDDLSSGFIYMVSSYAITGSQGGISDQQVDYFKRIENMRLKNPRLIGFGISNRDNFQKACEYAQGAIIGSAFIRAVTQADSLETCIADFIGKIRNTSVEMV